METINISTLKAHICAVLRKIRAGQEVLITDRHTPIAKLVPVSEESHLSVREPTSPLSYPEAPFTVQIDPLDVLLQDGIGR
jgi:prevent-host-death family protein